MKKQINKKRNTVNILYPTRSKWGVWSFDDDDLGIVGEPFVGSINTMIDMFAQGKEQAVVYISHSPIPESSLSLTQRLELGTGMYQLDGTEIVGWLCPCTLNYFEDYPEKIYARIN